MCHRDDAHCIIEGPANLVYDVLCAASKEDRDALGVGAACDEDHVRLADLALLDLGRASQIVRGKVVDVRDYPAAGCL